MHYQDGEGVTQDFVTAHMWLSLAAAQDPDRYGEARDTVAERMTAEQISEAERLASEWQPTQPSR